MAQEMYQKAEKIYAALRQSQILLQARREWTQYREQLTDYVVENTEAGTTIAVFGAGRSADLDLRCLAEHFREITLLDADEEAMRDALEYYWPEGQQDTKAKIQCIAVSFTGIPEEAYLMYAQALLEDVSGTAAREILEEIYAACCGYHLVKAVEEKRTPYFDYVISAGVHSQLNNMPAWICETVWKLRTQESGALEWLFQRIRTETASIVERYNDALLQMTGRVLFLGCEAGRAVRMEEQQKINPLSWGEQKETMWYFLPDTEVDGAWQAIQNVQERVRTGEITMPEYFDIVWPFLEEKEICFRMLVFMLCKSAV